MRVLKTTAFVSLTALLCFSSLGAYANEQLQEMAADSKNWVMPTGDYANTRYSELDQINKDNVKDLQVKWTFSTGVLRGHEGGPLVFDGVMYFNTPFPNIVYALDLNNDGRILWKYEPKQDANVTAIMCCDTVDRGLDYAPADGDHPALILECQADTTLVALHAKTGEVVWQVQNGEHKHGSLSDSGTAAPMVFKDKVLVGISGAEF